MTYNPGTVGGTYVPAAVAITGGTIAGVTVSSSTVKAAVRVVTAAGAITHVSTDNIIVVNKTVGAATTVNLMASPTTGQTVTIKDGKGDALNNNITIVPNAGTVDGATNVVLQANYVEVVLFYNGTEWSVASTGYATQAVSTLAVIATNSTTPRTLAARFADVVNIKDFGAIGDGSNDDTSAINAAITYARTSTNNDTRKIIFPMGNYKITGPINLTGFSADSNFFGSTLIIEAWGATLNCAFNGGCAVDMMGSRWIVILGLNIYANTGGFIPDIGLQMGRTTGAAFEPDKIYFDRLRIVGRYNKACLYSFSTEDVCFNSVLFQNQLTTGGYALIMDACNHWSVTSTFVTISATANAVCSMNDNTFYTPCFMGASTTTSTIWLSGGVARMTVIDGYCLASAFTSAVTIDLGVTTFPLTTLNFNCHCESNNLTTIFLITSSTGAVNNKRCIGVRFADEKLFATTSIFALDTGVTAQHLTNIDIDCAIMAGSATTTVMFDTPAQYFVSGKVILPSVVNWNAPASFVGTVLTGSQSNGEGDAYTQYGTTVPNTRVVIAAGAVTMSSTDRFIIVNKTSGAATAVALIASPVVGKMINIKDGKGDANTNNITITPAAGNIDGAATRVINTAFGSVSLIYNGTQWNVA